MKIFNRIWMFLYVLLILCLSAGLIVALWYPPLTADLIAQGKAVLQSWQWKAIITAIAAVLVVLIWRSSSTR